MRNSYLRRTDRQTDRQTETKVHLLSCASQLKIIFEPMSDLHDTKGRVQKKKKKVGIFPLAESQQRDSWEDSRETAEKTAERQLRRQLRRQLKDSWKTAERQLRDSWKTAERQLKDSWEIAERQLRRQLEDLSKNYEDRAKNSTISQMDRQTHTQTHRVASWAPCQS